MVLTVPCTVILPRFVRAGARNQESNQTSGLRRAASLSLLALDDLTLQYTCGMNGLAGKAVLLGEREGADPMQILASHVLGFNRPIFRPHSGQVGCRTQAPNIDAPSGSVEGPLSTAKLVHTTPTLVAIMAARGGLTGGPMD